MLAFRPWARKLCGRVQVSSGLEVTRGEYITLEDVTLKIVLLRALYCGFEYFICFVPCQCFLRSLASSPFVSSLTRPRSWWRGSLSSIWRKGGASGRHRTGWGPGVTGTEAGSVTPTTSTSRRESGHQHVFVLYCDILLQCPRVDHSSHVSVIMSTMSGPPRWCTEWSPIWQERVAVSPWPWPCRKPPERTVILQTLLSFTGFNPASCSDSSAHGSFRWRSSLPEREDWHQELHPGHQAARSLRLWTGPVVKTSVIFTFWWHFYLNFIDNKTVFNGRMILLMELLNLIGININYVFTLTFMEKKSPVKNGFCGRWTFFSLALCMITLLRQF